MKCVERGCPYPVKVRARRLCNRHYLRLYRRGLLAPLDRFWPQVDKSGFCWSWTGYKGKGGYGRFGGLQAHRVAYEKTYGPIPTGMTIDHSCRNPSCVKPEHLRLRTPSENFSDTLQARRDRCARGHAYTEENTHIRLRNGRRARVCRACDRERHRKAKDARS